MNRLLVVLLVLAVPNGLAQTNWGEPLIVDPSGDVRMENPAVNQEIGQQGNIDIRQAWVAEDPTHIHLMLELESLEGSTTTGGDTRMEFTAGEWRYTVYMFRGIEQEEGFFGSSSRRHVTTDQYEFLQTQRVFGNVEEGLIWTSLPRAMMATANEPLHAGAALRDVVAIGRNQEFWAGGEQFSIWDKAPDSGDGPSVPLTWRVNEGGDIKMRTPEPFRSSNGEATTYQFEVTVRNSGPTVAAPISIVGAPVGWNVTLPGSFLRLETNQVFQFIVQADVPFAHQHGSAEGFEVIVGSQDEPLARLQMGVFYLPVPQPAGHHANVYFHSHMWSKSAEVVNPAAGGATGYYTFNTLAEDLGDAGEPIHAFAWTGTSESSYRWNLCLDPGLMMGLEWDQENPGQTLFTLDIETPIRGAVIEGDFYIAQKSDVNWYCSVSGESSRVATFRQELGDLDPMSSVNVEAAVEALTKRTEYAPGNQLGLQIRVVTPGPIPMAIGAPSIANGGSISLPLLEYHDALRVSTSALDGTPNTAAGPLSEPEPESKKSPAVSLVGGLGLLALAVLRRRS